MSGLGGQRRVLVLLVLLAVLRGGYWAVASPTPSPVDEIQHVDYARSLARLEGIPTVGRDRVADEILELAKASPTYFLRSDPYPADFDDPRWRGAAVAQSYEGIQGPTYYLLIAPSYWLGRPWGMTGSFYALRIGSVVLGALALPLAWLLTRRLLPRRPGAWLVPPALLAGLNALNAGSALVSNDIVVLTGAGAAAVLLLRALERRTALAAAGAGATAAMVIVGKTTALPIIPLLALLGLPHLVRWWREDAAGAIRWTAVYAVAFGVPLAGWLAWNVWSYRAISAATVVESITGSLQPTFTPSLRTFGLDWESVRTGFSAAGGMAQPSRYGRLWEIVACGVIGTALLLAMRSRRGRDLETAGPMAWGLLAYPLTFLTVTLTFFVTLERSGLVIGRYLWVAVVPLAVALGVALHKIAGRYVVVLVLACLVPIAWAERDMTFDTLRREYERDLVGNDLAPVVDQSWNDEIGRPDTLLIDVGCVVGAVDLALVEPPTEITLRGRQGPVSAVVRTTRPYGLSSYTLDRPTEGPLTIELPSSIGVSRTERAPEVSLARGGGDPTVRVHCPVDDPGGLRFDQVYGPGHPPVSASLLRAWPNVNLALLASALGMSVLWAERDIVVRQRRRRVNASR